MENYEINILKRNGDWEKYNQKDIPVSSTKNIPQEKLMHKVKNDKNEKINFLSYINEELNRHSTISTIGIHEHARTALRPSNARCRA
jgi:predicted restriction endonuclease